MYTYHTGMVYPLVIRYSSLWKIAIDIVAFPSYNMVIFHSYVKLPEGKYMLYIYIVPFIWVNLITTSLFSLTIDDDD